MEDKYAEGYAYAMKEWINRHPDDVDEIRYIFLDNIEIETQNMQEKLETILGIKLF